MIVKATCPAVVRHVPAGGRHERLDVVALEHEVRLTRGDPGRFAFLVDASPIGVVHLSEGRLWCRLERPADGGVGKPYSEAEFVAWLSAADGDRLPDPNLGFLAKSFVRTPLAAETKSLHKGGGFTKYLTRGSRKPLRSRETISDLRAGAGARLQSYLDDNVRLVGGCLFLRFDAVGYGERFDRGEVAAVVHVTPNAIDMPRPLARLDRIPDVSREETGDQVLAIIDAFDRLEDPGGEDRILAIGLPPALLESLELLKALDPGRAVPPRLSDIARDLRAHADRGMTGWIEDADIPLVLALSEEAATILSASRVERVSAPWARMAGHLGSGLVAGLHRADPEDEGHLSGLAPGPGSP